MAPSLSTAPVTEPNQAIQFNDVDHGDGGATATTRGVQVSLQKLPRPPTFSDKHEEREYLKGRLALAFRVFGRNGYDEGVAGHITLRDPVKPDHFWVNPFGMPFSHIRKSDLILVDHAGTVIDGGNNRLLNIAAFMIHSAIHEARPDVLCAAHSHSIYGRSFSTLGQEIDISTQDSCAFYKDHVVYKSQGVVLAKEEGHTIAKALGDRKAIILQNHGILTVGQTIEGCIFWFNTLENCCRVQLLADAAATGRGIKVTVIDDEDAEFTYKSVGTPRAGWFSALPAFALAGREAGLEVYE
ncbi:hypothetical protein N7478_004175 [Penicillium angulare]|uniref:uncharacterized protein n=1 Tax=Penicillium angulare TaxID=116970 RepID=UPI00254146D5|nr:uncharacterized protein N7478_004175 [Penicillium angulare]KAJ5278803.1 hypothetical protein N7478_004175 [Penicillium angulare]